MSASSQPAELQCPRATDDVARVVRSLKHNSCAVGSRTSKSPCFETAGTELRLDHFNQLAMAGENRVRVGAGVTLNRLLDYLSRHGLALPTIGEWDGQTVGGAISTGTHGGSYRYGSLIDSVMEAELITGKGEVKTYRRGTKGFQHVLPSFGTVGVFSEFILQCEPSFQLLLERRTQPVGRFVDALLSPRADVEFRSAIWLPAAGFVLDYAASRVDGALAGLSDRREVRFNDTAMVLDWLTKQSARTGLKGRIQKGQAGTKLAATLFPAKDYCGSYDRMLAPLKGTAETILKKRARNRTPPEGEFAVEVSQARAFLTRLEQDMDELGAFPDRPIGLRPGTAEDGTLSPTQGQDCIWVSMFLYRENPLMRRLPDRLVEFGARPHWGKCVFHRPEDICGLFDGWGRYKRFRSRLDPERKFINRFALSLGL